jgi:hypothetical protein
LRAVDAVRRILGPLGTLAPTADDPTRLVLDASGRRYVLRVRWAGEGFPEDVRRALADRPARRRGEALVVAARRISSGARDVLSAQGVSWADETGAAHIVASPGLLVDRAGDRAATARSPGAWTWSASAAAVGEVALADSVASDLPPDEPFLLPRADELARRAHVSTSAVNGTLRGWQQEGWVAQTGGTRGPTSRRELVAPGDLLSSWAAWSAAAAEAEVAAHLLLRDPVAWARSDLPRLFGREVAWCVGGLVASELEAPYATSVPRVVCHIDAAQIEATVADLVARGAIRLVTTGARLVLRPAARATVGLARGDAPPVASVPRVYADLLREGPRAEDLAQHYREVTCGF